MKNEFNALTHSPELNTVFFTPFILAKNPVTTFRWQNSAEQNRLLGLGLCFDNSEDAVHAAEAMLKAAKEFSKQHGAITTVQKAFTESFLAAPLSRVLYTNLIWVIGQNETDWLTNGLIYSDPKDAISCSRVMISSIQ